MTITAATPGFLSVCTVNGVMHPAELRAVSEGDTVRIAFDLAPLLGSDTVSATYDMDADDLTFANKARANANTQVEADVSGFNSGQAYSIELTATLTSGAKITKRVRIKCEGDCSNGY